MAASLHIMKEAGARIVPETIEIGENAGASGSWQRTEGGKVTHRQIVGLLDRIQQAGIDSTKSKTYTRSMAKRATWLSHGE